jgi:hypothetical protein
MLYQQSGEPPYFSVVSPWLCIKSPQYCVESPQSLLLLASQVRQRVRRRIGGLGLAQARMYPVGVLKDWCTVWCTTTACIVLASVIAYRMYTLPLPQSRIASQRSLRSPLLEPASKLNIMLFIHPWNTILHAYWFNDKLSLMWRLDWSLNRKLSNRRVEANRSLNQRQWY